MCQPMLAGLQQGGAALLLQSSCYMGMNVRFRPVPAPQGIDRIASSGLQRENNKVKP